MKKDIFLSLLSGLLLTLSFLRPNIWLFAWFGFVPLFFAIKDKPKAKVFLFSYITGIMFWFSTIYWLIHVTLIGLILLVLYLALYFGIFALISKIYELRVMSYELLFLPSIWVLLEYLRNYLFTGFPWALLGYSQYLNLPVVQIADITGIWGVSFLVMMVNVAIYLFFSRRQKYSLPILCIFITLIYGYYQIYRPMQNGEGLKLKASVVQGNIAQELKWNPESNYYIINKYLDISRQAAKDRPDLIIWPEAALPVVLEEEPLFFILVENFAKEIKRPLVLGAVTKRSNLYYNSAVLVSREGQVLARYDKLHLVPFGEYIPLKKILPFLETIVPIGDITPGKEYTIFKIPNPKSQIPNESRFPISKITNSFAVLICFEDLFPELSREFIKKGANFLVNITNDAWYKQTAAPYQHLQASVFRAVENRVFLVRSANTGVSGFIRPNGKIISLIQDQQGRDIFISGYNTQEIHITKRGSSFYTRYGDIFILACFLFVLYGIIFRPRE